MPRKLLPVVVVPLDDFGKTVSSVFEETLALAEPALLRSQWVRILPVWSEEKHLVHDQTIADALTLTSELGDSAYENASPSFPKVVVVPVGSLSLHKDRVLPAFQALMENLSTKRYVDQLDIFPIMDVSSITDEDNVPFAECIQDMHQVLTELTWRDHLYLVDNYSGATIRTDDRGDIIDAVRLFLEAFAMGGVWKHYAQSWLQKKPQSRQEQFASFSIFSLASPQTDLIRYLSHVGFYQLWDWASAEVNRESLNGNALELPGQKLVFKSTAAEDSPAVNKIPSPGLLEPKAGFKRRLQRAINDFEFRLSGWREQVRHELERARFQYINQAEEHIRDFREKIAVRLEKVLNTARFVSSLKNELEVFQRLAEKEREKPPAEGRIQLLETIQVEGMLEPVYNKIAKRAEKLPNPPSLVFHVLVLVGMLYGVNQELLKYWPWRVANIHAWFWGLTTLLLVLFVYLSWRIPRWRVARLLTRDFKVARQRIVQSIHHTCQELRDLLATHWAAKRTRAVKKDLYDAVLSIRKGLAHQRGVVEEKKERFPYPDVDWDFVRAKEGVYLKFFEPPTNLDVLLEKLHRGPEELLPAVEFSSEALTQALLKGDVAGVEKTFLNAVRSQFAEIEFEIGEDVVSRMKEAATGMVRFQSKPMLKLPTTTKMGYGKLYCAANADWDEYLKEAFGKLIEDTTVVDMASKDRIYFFQTYYNIPLDKLLHE